MDHKTLVGTLFADRFHIERLLGVGGMGSVYLARHDVLQRRFALKVIRPELLDDPGIVERFRREARAASRIQHPNVVEIVDFGSAAGGQPYLAMEYVEGPSLGDVLQQDGPFAVERALAVLGAMASALAAAHRRGVIHRDLKPRNIILASQPQPDTVKVLDFGLATIIGIDTAARLTEAGEIFGTPEYMAPERCLDDGIDPRSDLYSLGVLTFELLAGRPPFCGSPVEVITSHIERQHDSLTELRDDVPAPVEALIDRCLAKRPDERFQRAEEIAEAVEAMLGGSRRRQTGSVQAIAGPTEPILGSPATDELGASVISVDETMPPRVVERVESLEELTCALRDRELGAPELSYSLAMLYEAHERRLEAEHASELRARQVWSVAEGARRRELVLGQVLTQLGHELAQLEGIAAFEDTIPPDQDPERLWATRSLLEACVRNLEQRQRDIARQRERQVKTLENEQHRWEQALQRARVEEEQQLADLEQQIHCALVAASLADQDLRRLCERAGIQRRSPGSAV